jgi:hypothetical protein
MKTWRVPYVLLDDKSSADDLAAEYRKAQSAKRAGAALIAE